MKRVLQDTRRPVSQRTTKLDLAHGTVTSARTNSSSPCSIFLKIRAFETSHCYLDSKELSHITVGFPRRQISLSLVVNLAVALVSSQMSLRVSILWFHNRDSNSNNDYHWSIFICPANSAIGTKYDAFATIAEDGDFSWEPSQALNYNEQQSAYLGGSFELGYISDENSFAELMLSVPMPGSGENCQTWVTNVVAKAVQQRVLPKSANKVVKEIPVRA